MNIHAGVDTAINYEMSNWWEEEEFKLHPFDVVLLLSWHAGFVVRICHI